MTNNHTPKDIEHFMSHDLPERIAKVETSVEHLAKTNEKLVETQSTIVQLMSKMEVTLENLAKIEPKMGVIERHMTEQQRFNEQTSDHEKRLSKLESRWMKISGAVVVIAFGWTILGQKILTALGFA